MNGGSKDPPFFCLYQITNGCKIVEMKDQVQVYRNLHKTLEDGTKVYSVKNDKGIVVDHVTQIAIYKPILRVGPKGNKRVRDEKRKNVHAYMQGKKMRESLIDDYNTGIGIHEWKQITYNPYRHKSFVLVEDESVAVREAWFAEVRRDGVWVYLPEPSTTGKLFSESLSKKPHKNRAKQRDV